jgi:hypothetical protein
MNVNLDFAHALKILQTMVMYSKGCILSMLWLQLALKLSFYVGKC